MAAQRRKQVIDLSHEPRVDKAALRAVPQPPHRLVMGADRSERLSHKATDLIVNQRKDLKFSHQPLDLGNLAGKTLEEKRRQYAPCVRR